MADVERKLAAILSADVVGYSRLMAEDEAATIRTLTAYREQVTTLVQEHRGRVVDFTGDNFLAEFPTALDAVQGAAEIQRVIHARNADLPDDRRMQFRIGIHLGDVSVEGGRLYGDGVNIAARLEGLAEVGGICISATVYEQVRRKLELEYEDLGEQEVKNIPDPVRVFSVKMETEIAPPETRPRSLRRAALAAGAVIVIVALGIVVTWPLPLGLLVDTMGLGGPLVRPPLPDKPSIAVLPFENMSGDPAQEYFSDGITEELTSDLARIPELFVIARNSAFVYKGRPVNVEDVGRELGVRYVVEGSVRRSTDRVRITAQLIDATTGFHLWSERYDRDLADIFEVQSKISQEILVALSGEMRDAALEQIAHRSTRDLMAYDAFARGASHYWRFTREDNSEARRMFERAIERDPGFGMARAFLGGTYLMEFTSGWNLDAELMERCEEHARRAIELDPAIPTGHVLLAGVHVYRGRLDEAVAAAERGVALGPNVEPPHLMLALALAKQGRMLAALRSLDRAMRLNPRGTSLGWMVAVVVNQAAGRTERAVELLERVRADNSDMILARVLLAAIYEGEGRHDEAREVVREILRVNPQFTVEAVIQVMALTAAVPPGFQENLRKAGLPDKAPPIQEFTVPGFSGVPAVAVLPFDDLSEDGGQQYFADGLAEDLLTRLSGYRWFPVIARNSSFTYRGQVDVKQVSRELGVRYVVEGSVRRAGDRVRISAQLIDATTGHHVWAKTYDRELGDIFAVQDELTEEITASISPELVRSESARALRREPRNLDAFEFLARGRWHLFRWTRDDNVRARSYFERALDLDPQLAVAFSEIAWTHYYDIMNGWTDSPTRSITALERAARSCLAVDELFAGCHLGMGYFYLTTGKQDMAIATLERSVQLNPNLADVYGALGMALAVAGRSDEAMSSLEKAMRLSPQDPWMGFYLVSAGWAQFAAERYEDAVSWSERALQASPGDRDIATFAHRMLAASYAQLGRLDEAREALAEELRLEPDLTLEKVRSQNPTTDPDFLERWLDGLRKAGLEE